MLNWQPFFVTEVESVAEELLEQAHQASHVGGVQRFDYKVLDSQPWIH